ncbi:PMM1 [Auxenochlorella protothecoides x Auxenochlorella symbiontica]|uniref:Phosphomannomutase n=1 Tax=Auxenochlorella protothecoides TaxID=3075 RepID=A0A1D1ZVJ5_AUXPR
MTKRVLALFDVDGTLTVARKDIEPDMVEHLKKLRKAVKVGTVGGSDLAKQLEQLGKTVLEDFDFVFAENGLVAYEAGKLLAVQSIAKHLGEESLQRLLNFMLQYLSGIELPVKRGTFIEFRKGMLNVSPIGRNCCQEERDAFEVYDLKHGIRAKFLEVLKEKFADLDLTYSIGGQISFDVFPKGWDKTYCLRYVREQFDEIHFFGDKTFEGGNDYEIFESPETIGHTVNGPADTIAQTTKLFL